MQRKVFSLLILAVTGIGVFLLAISSRTQASLTAPDISEKSESTVVYQTSHIESRRDALGNEARWIGDLRALSLDSQGNQQMLWSANQRLSSLKDVTTQRNYTDPASEGRHIFTYLDFNGDGMVQDMEVKDFLPSTFDTGSYGILNVPDIASARTLVNYIRGDESQNSAMHLRNRMLDFDGDGPPKIMRLGDIVHSSALEVGTPAEAFDLLYGDASYGQFRRQYAERRRVVYLGANDGMIHAFNAGFYNSKSHSYTPQGNGSETRHPLGSELWAYVPGNLLAQLKKLQSPDYDHAWYMDGKPRIFDARIFAPDKTHPGGWGTVMVMGMRLGGSLIRLDAKTNRGGLSAFTSSNAEVKGIQQQAAFVLMDVTDPEQKPVLLAEITDPSGSIGYTTSLPVPATFTSASSTTSGDDNHWYLIFGSGPTLTDTEHEIPATSGNTAKLFVYDLIRRRFIQRGKDLYLYDLGSDTQSGAPDSFVGDPVAVDWDLNYKADALYFGTAGGNSYAPNGKLFKLDFRSPSSRKTESPTPEEWTAPVMLSNPGNPVLAAPAVTKDESGHHWIMSGTGRFHAKADEYSTQAQSLFGIVDALPTQPVDYKNLVDVSHAVVSEEGKIQGVPAVTSVDALAKLTQKQNGWKRELPVSAGFAAERSISSPALLGGILFFTTFTPRIPGNTQGGSTHLYCLNYKTGIVDPKSGSCNSPSSIAGAHSIASDSVDSGDGTTASPSLYLDDSHSSDLSVLTQSYTGALTLNHAHTFRDLHSGEIDWREIHP